MARFGNRVKESTETTGTGTLDLSGAPTGFRGFADEFTSGDDDISYLIVDDPDNPTDYEYGKGTFTSGTPDTLSRDTVEGSSNSGNKVSFTSGTKTVIATPLAADFNLIAGLDEAFVDVASATTTDIGAATSRNVRITGTVTITGLGTVAAGTTRRIRFADALTLTHNGTSLILPGAANITTEANATAAAVSLGSGNWIVTDYEPADGRPLVDWEYQSSVDSSSGTELTFSGISAKWTEIELFPVGMSSNGTAGYYLQMGDADGFETSGYSVGASTVGASSVSSQTDADEFALLGAASTAANLMAGVITLKLVDAATFRWALRSSLNASSAAATFSASGAKALTAALTQLRIDAGGDTFDAGTVYWRGR